VGIDAHFHREPDLQGMRPQLRGVEGDAHGHALHDLDPVAGRVLGRKQREGAAGSGAEAGELAVVFDRAAIGVGDELHRLPGAEVGELAFLEVRVHPTWSSGTTVMSGVPG